VNHHWWFHGWSAQQIDDFTDQYGTRLVFLDRLPIAAGATTYSGAFVNNLNAPETRGRDLMDADIDDGFWGFYCKRISGSVVSGLQHDRPFEPASALKLLHHVTAFMAMEAPGSTITLASQFPYLGGGGNGQPGYDSCPNPNDPNVQSFTLQNLLTLVMNPSDNEATYAITTNFGGFGLLNANAASLGMTNTSLNWHIGCANPPNFTTLRDLGRIHESVSTGLLSPPNVATFRTIMINGWSQNLTDIINQEFDAAGMPGFYRAPFTSQIQYATKGGNYGFGNGTFSRSGATWISLPHKAQCQASPREFTYGGYYNNITNDTLPGSQTALSRATHEQMREQVRAAIESWMSVCIADADQDGDVDVPDIFFFLTLWFRGDGDFNANGRNEVPDIFAFLSAWFAT